MASTKFCSPAALPSPTASLRRRNQTRAPPVLPNMFHHVFEVVDDAVNRCLGIRAPSGRRKAAGTGALQPFWTFCPEMNPTMYGSRHPVRQASYAISPRLRMRAAAQGAPTVRVELRPLRSSRPLRNASRAAAGTSRGHPGWLGSVRVVRVRLPLPILARSPGGMGGELGRGAGTRGLSAAGAWIRAVSSH